MGRKLIPITDEHLRIMEEAAGFGIPNKRIARLIGLSPATLERRIQDNPDIVRALERGKATSQASLTRVLWEMAHNEGAKDRDREIAAMFLLKVVHHMWDTPPKAPPPNTDNLTDGDRQAMKELIAIWEERKRETVKGQLEATGETVGGADGSVDRPNEPRTPKTE